MLGDDRNDVAGLHVVKREDMLGRPRRLDLVFLAAIVSHDRAAFRVEASVLVPKFNHARLIGIEGKGNKADRAVLILRLGNAAKARAIAHRALRQRHKVLAAP